MFVIFKTLQNIENIRCSVLEAIDILDLSIYILRCAILDNAGRILSYGESEKGKEAKLPANFSVTIKAMAILGLSQALPKDLANVRFTEIVSDKYRLVTMPLSGQTIMFALPLQMTPDPICEVAIKKIWIKFNEATIEL